MRGNVVLEVSVTGTGDLEGKVQKATSAVDRLKAMAGGLGPPIATMITGFNQGFELLDKIGNKAKQVVEFVRQGVEANNVSTIFAAQFSNSAAALEAFRSATRGTLDDTTLQRMSTQMGLVGLSAEKTAQIMEGAFALSMASGKDMGEVVSSVLGALRGEMDSLQEKGVAVDLDTTYDKWAASLGKAAKALSETEKAAARQEAVLAALSQTADKVPVDKLANGFSRLSTAWDNLVSDIQTGIASALEPLADGLADLISGATGSRDALEGLSIGSEGAMGQLIALGNATARANERLSTFEALMRGITEVTREKSAAEKSAAYEADQAAHIAKMRTDVESVARANELASLKDKLYALDKLEAASIKMSGRQRADLSFQREQLEIREKVIKKDLTEAEAKRALTLAILKHEAALATPEAKKKQELSPLSDVDILMAGALVSYQSATALADGQIDAFINRYNERSDEMVSATGRSMGLSDLRARGDLLVAQAALDDGDRLGRLRLDHEYEISKLIRESKDAEVTAELLRLEELRYVAEERSALRELEAERFAESLSTIQDSAQTLAQMDSTGIAGGLVAAGGQIARSWGDLAKGSPQAIAAVGAVGASFIKNETAKAAVMSLTELAAGWAALATPGLQALAPAHFTSSAIYAAAAGMSALGGGGGKGAAIAAPGFSGGGSVGTKASVGGGFSSGGFGSGKGSDSTTIINYGVLGVPSFEASQGLARILGRSEGSGLGAGRL